MLAARRCQTIDVFGEISGVSFTPDGSALFVGIYDLSYSSLLEYRLAPGAGAKSFTPVHPARQTASRAPPFWHRAAGLHQAGRGARECCSLGWQRLLAVAGQPWLVADWSASTEQSGTGQQAPAAAAAWRVAMVLMHCR